MFAALVLAAAATTPVDPAAWASLTCARPPPASDTVAAMTQEEHRTACLKAGMDAAIDQVILPLKKQRKKKEQFRGWMAVQADFNRFLVAACAVEEDAAWMGLATGNRTSGSGAGFTELACRQRLHAFRAAFALSFKAGPDVVVKFVKQAATHGEEHRAAFQDAYERVTEWTGRQDTTPATGERVTQAEWRRLSERIAEVVRLLAATAAGQCALGGIGKPKDCEETMESALWSQLELEWAE